MQPWNTAQQIPCQRLVNPNHQIFTKINKIK
jgi:hypothetical protein